MKAVLVNTANYQITITCTKVEHQDIKQYLSKWGSNNMMKSMKCAPHMRTYIQVKAPKTSREASFHFLDPGNQSESVINVNSIYQRALSTK